VIEGDRNRAARIFRRISTPGAGSATMRPQLSHAGELNENRNSHDSGGHRGVAGANS
jgi:hypothetical protein